jgi:hypothetical protein
MGFFVKDIAPNLYEYILGDVNRRSTKSFPDCCKPEIVAILELAKRCPPSALAQFNSELEKTICPSSGCSSSNKTPTTEISTKHCEYCNGELIEVELKSSCHGA